MNRMSTRAVLTATGVGMTLLLAACGSGGSSSAAGSPSGAADTGSTASSPAQTDTGAAGTATGSSTSGSASSTAEPAPSTSGTQPGKPPATPSIHPSAGDRPVPVCGVDQLRITVGRGNSDMQGAHRPLRFTNTGKTACKLTGAPGVSYVAGDDGHQVGKAAKRIVGHQPMVLIPNETVSAGLFLSSAPEKSDCQQVHVRGLRVYPPDSYQAAFVPLPGVTCASGGPYLTVGPVKPGSGNTV